MLTIYYKYFYTKLKKKHKHHIKYDDDHKMIIHDRILIFSILTPQEQHPDTTYKKRTIDKIGKASQIGCT